MAGIIGALGYAIHQVSPKQTPDSTDLDMEEQHDTVDTVLESLSTDGQLFNALMEMDFESSENESIYQETPEYDVTDIPTRKSGFSMVTESKTQSEDGFSCSVYDPCDCGICGARFLNLMEAAHHIDILHSHKPNYIYQGIIQHPYERHDPLLESLTLDIDLDQQLIDILINMFDSETESTDRGSIFDETSEYEVSSISTLDSESGAAAIPEQRKKCTANAGEPEVYVCNICPISHNFFTSIALARDHFYEFHKREREAFFSKSMSSNQLSKTCQFFDSTTFFPYITRYSYTSTINYRDLTQPPLLCDSIPQYIQPSASPSRRTQLDASVALIRDAFKHRNKYFIAIDFEGLITQGLPTQIGFTVWPMEADENSESYTYTNLWLIPKDSNSAAFQPGPTTCLNYSAINAFNREISPAHTTTLSEISAKISEDISNLKQNNPNFILVVHGGSSDLQCLKRMGVDLEGVQILDTQILDAKVRMLLRSTGYVGQLQRSLRNCVKANGVPHLCGDFHNAANDSYYTMMLLNKLGKRYMEFMEKKEKGCGI